MARTPRARPRKPRAILHRRLPRPGATREEDEVLFGGGRLVFPYDPHAGIPSDAAGIWFFLSGATARVYDLISSNARLRSWLYDLRSDHRRPGQLLYIEGEDPIEIFGTLIGGHFEMLRVLARMCEEQFVALDLGEVDPGYADEVAAAVADLDLDDVDWDQLAGMLVPLADAARPYGEHGTAAELPGHVAREEPDQSREADQG